MDVSMKSTIVDEDGDCRDSDVTIVDSNISDVSSRVTVDTVQIAEEIIYMYAVIKLLHACEYLEYEILDLMTKCINSYIQNQITFSYTFKYVKATEEKEDMTDYMKKQYNLLRMHVRYGISCLPYRKDIQTIFMYSLCIFIGVYFKY